MANTNPISYKLKPVRLDVILHLTALRKQVKRIFRSFMKRMRAAYKYKNDEINASQALREDSKQHELRMWASRCADQEEEINTMFNQVMDALTPTKWSAYVARGVFDVRSLNQIANDKIDDCNKGIKTAEEWVKRVENAAFSVPRGQTPDPSGFTEREHRVYQARIRHKNLKALMLELKTNYPYIREKYRNRLAKMIFAFIEDEQKHGMITRGPKSIFHAANYTMDVLVKAGIPAADVVGPWWPHAKGVKSPMDYVKLTGIRGASVESPDGESAMSVSDHESPTHKRWLTFHGLDGQDPTLSSSVLNYYNHHKTIPSVEWARRRSNELEAERKQQELTKKIKPVREWLKASERALKACTIGIPPTHREWRIVKPDDAQELCERAQRDGLCVVDVISRMATDSDDEEDWLDRCNREGVCSLLFSTDPHCRTIVGLDANGKCTSEHHCTGKDNEVDDEAWEYFREK